MEKDDKEAAEAARAQVQVPRLWGDEDSKHQALRLKGAGTSTVSLRVPGSSGDHMRQLMPSTK